MANNNELHFDTIHLINLSANNQSFNFFQCNYLVNIQIKSGFTNAFPPFHFAFLLYLYPPLIML